MNLRHILIVAGFAAFACPAVAQLTVPNYRDSAGQSRSAQGVVVLNTAGTTGADPLRGSSTSVAAIIVAGGAYQSALSANLTRKGCALYNKSAETMQVFLGAPGSATAATSIPVPAGGSLNCGSPQGLVITDQLSVTSATTGSAFLVVSQ